MSRICNVALIVGVLVAGCAENADTFCPVYADVMARIHRGELTEGRAALILEPHANQCTKCQAREADRLLFQTVQTGLRLYYDDVGHYPSEEEGGLKALWIKPNFSDEKIAEKWQGPYLPGEPREGWADKLHYEPASPGMPHKLWSGPMPTTD